MKQRFVVEIDWEDEEAVDAAWFERIVYDGLEDNGVFKSEYGIKGEWKTLEVLLEEERNSMLLVNMGKCLKCGDVLISHHRHDFVECSCRDFAVDGGAEYTRRFGTPSDYLELSLTEDSPFEEIRKYLCRGSRGVSGEEPLKWIPLCEIDDCYLSNLIQFKIDKQQTQDIHYLMYLKEAAFRLECDKVS